MDSYYTELARAAWREIINFRRWVVVCFILVSLAVLVVGMLKPKSYSTSAVLYVDVTNIIEPLLKGPAEFTGIDRSEQARESIYTRRIIERVARNVNLLDLSAGVEAMEGVINGLRNRIDVRSEGPRYFRVSYTDEDQDKSFRILNEIVDTFIREAADRKRTESRGAYEFIDEQVKSYKRQLTIAESNLKEFKANNLDGDEGSVKSRIAKFRLQLEELGLEIDELVAKEKSVRNQLENESQYLAKKGKIDAYRERLASLQTKLDDLLLSYQETYPDVVSTRTQMREIRESIAALESSPETPILETDSVDTGQAENPLYEELRKNLADIEAKISSKRRRREVVVKLHAEEIERAKRVAARQADLSELVRDYDVTRGIYEEMLERKEKARLSMTLDQEGQGVSYRIQEPAVFPLKPSGLRLIHFTIAGPFVGLIAAIALVILYVMVDPRFRGASIMEASLPEDIELLGHVTTIKPNRERKAVQMSLVRLFAVAVIYMVAYGALAYSRASGWI